MRRAALVVLLACQGSSTTPFPPGLEPFEPDPVPPLTGPPDEMLRTSTSDSDYIRVYGRGDVLVPMETVFANAMNPDVIAAVCSTTSHTAMIGNEPEYTYSVLIHYVENNVLTVEWDDQWRFGTIDPTFEMVKHQKVDGSTFITRSEGTIEMHATDDPNVTELDFVEHLDSIGASVDDVLHGVEHTYASIVAAAHGQPAPACP
jgi:hypothetical protein